MKAQLVLDPKDLVVLLQLAYGQPDSPWTYASLAHALRLSPSQVHASVARAQAAGLLQGKGLKGKVNREGLLNFVLHGARYAFPPVLGRVTRGFPTGCASALFPSSSLPKEGAEVRVWPSPRGDARGVSLAPLHPSVPLAALGDEALHRALVAFDGIRAGDARERQAAEAFFRKSLAWPS